MYNYNEQHFLKEWLQYQIFLTEKLIVNYRRIKKKAEQLKRESGISSDEFKCCTLWIFRFSGRHNPSWTG